MLGRVTVTLVAVADDNPEGLAAATKRLKLDRGYADYRTMLDREKPQFVAVAPRWLDRHPEAIKVPYAHSNVQADEVLYYVRGRFGSRRGGEESSFTLHPRGIPHGPHPGTIVASRSMTQTDELAVMVDTVKPLLLTQQAIDMDDPKYPYSWLES